MSRPANHARPIIMLLALFMAAALLAGCGVTQLVKDTASAVGEYFESDSYLRKRVVMIPFSSAIKGLDVRAKAYGKILRSRLSKQNMFTLTDPDKLLAVMRQIPASVRDPEERMILAARRLGLNTILTGKLSDLSVAYDLTGIYGFRENTPFLRLEADVALLDVATGTLLARRSLVMREKLSDEVAEGIKLGKSPDPKMVDKLQAQLIKPSFSWVSKRISKQRWTGYLLEVEGKKLKTSAGRDTGITPGMELVIYAQGERIITGSGRPVYAMGVIVGKARISKIMARTSWAEFIPNPDLIKEQPKDEAKDKSEAKDKDKAKEKEKAKAKPKPKPTQPKVGYWLRAY